MILYKADDSKVEIEKAGRVTFEDVEKEIGSDWGMFPASGGVIFVGRVSETTTNIRRVNQKASWLTGRAIEGDALFVDYTEGANALYETANDLT